MAFPYLKRFSFASSITLSDVKGDDYIYFPSFALALIDKEDSDTSERINKRIEFLKNEIARSEKMLSNQNFISKAKPEKVAAEKEKYQKYLDELNNYLKK